MIFPQGIFSGGAMAAVKHGEFIGTVSSEVISADPPAPPGDGRRLLGRWR